MSYNQAMKHWGNHRKDRFTQQCSGYTGPVGGTVEISEERFDEYSRNSMKAILKEGHSFPIYLSQDGSIGVWMVVPKNHIAGERIDSRDELLRFASDFAGIEE